MDYKPPRLLCPWVCHSLLQGVFLTQGLKPGHLHCRLILYHWATREALWLLRRSHKRPQRFHLCLLEHSASSWNLATILGEAHIRERGPTQVLHVIQVPAWEWGSLHMIPVSTLSNPPSAFESSLQRFWTLWSRDRTSPPYHLNSVRIIKLLLFLCY